MLKLAKIKQVIAALPDGQVACSPVQEAAFSWIILTSFLYAPVIILFDKIALRIMPNCLLPGQFFNDALTIL